ncbi:MAG: hypothetical protein WAN51_08340 [Alphaproteobacteria bacterium]
MDQRAASVAADAGIKAVIDAIRPGIPELTLCATAQVATAQAIPDGMELQTNCYMQQGVRSFLSHASSTTPAGESNSAIFARATAGSSGVKNFLQHADIGKLWAVGQRLRQ